MTTRIEQRWDALAPDPERPVFQLLDAEHPFSFYIGRQITGERMFLLVDTLKPPEIRTMRELGISSFRRADGRWGILLSLTNQDLVGIFGILCQDLVESSRHLPAGVSASAFVARRLSSWRLLLEQRRADLLSATELRGLFAELFVLNRWLVAMVNPHDAVKAWVGPLGADQDFQLSETAWEVKSVHPDADTVHIASERQLYSSTRNVVILVLTLVDVGSTGAGLSLNELVRQLRDQVGADADARSILDARLEAAGYLFREEYDSPRLAVVGQHAFAVGEGFPRFAPPGVPAGVSDVRYNLSLRACASFATNWPFGHH